MHKHERDTKKILGWREWISLPDLGIPAIKAKVDTGARTSALHAFELHEYKENNLHKVRFAIHPLQKRKDIEIFCVADVADYRLVSDSGGHRQMRYVINTPVQIGKFIKNIELTLTDRDTMQFRMLLGRTAMEKDYIVDPQLSYVSGRTLKNWYKKNMNNDCNLAQRPGINNE